MLQIFNSTRIISSLQLPRILEIKSLPLSAFPPAYSEGGALERVEQVKRQMLAQGARVKRTRTVPAPSSHCLSSCAKQC